MFQSNLFVKPVYSALDPASIHTGGYTMGETNFLSDYVVIP